jgi:thiamine biosynthesis lipoprotein
MKTTLLFLSFFALLFSVNGQVEPMYLEGQAQGTTYHITYFDEKQRDWQKDIDRLLKRFDKSVSTYQTNSLISKINHNQFYWRTDPYFNACFKKAKEIWTLTNGAFDPTVYPLVNAWGFGPEKKSNIEQSKIDSLLTFVGFEKIELTHGRIVKTDPRVSLDFNAFAQGYSVDLVSEFLRSKGITSFIVEIGGEVYAQGKRYEKYPWYIGLEQPIENKTSVNPLNVIFQLNNIGVATSGNYRRFTIENGVKIVHHIDPKTGKPTSNQLLSASIFTDRCISSDALATAILVMGLDKAQEFLAQHTEIQAYLIYSDQDGKYQVFITPKLIDWIADKQ